MRKNMEKTSPKRENMAKNREIFPKQEDNEKEKMLELDKYEYKKGGISGISWSLNQ